MSPVKLKAILYIRLFRSNIETLLVIEAGHMGDCQAFTMNILYYLKHFCKYVYLLLIPTSYGLTLDLSE